jgi:hypothetical protein
MMTTMMSQVAIIYDNDDDDDVTGGGDGDNYYKRNKKKKEKMLPIISYNSYLSPLEYYAIRLQGVRLPCKLQIILRLYTMMTEMVATITILI